MGYAAVVGSLYNMYTTSAAQSDAEAAAENQANASARAVELSAFKPYGTNSAFSTTRFTGTQQAERNVAYARANNIAIGPQPAMIGGGPRGEGHPNPNAGKIGFTDANGEFHSTVESVDNQYDPRVRQGIDNNLALGNTALQQANDRAKMAPEDLAKDRFSRYLTMVRPQQQQDFDKLLGGLAMSGTTGLGNNPAISSFAQGLANSDRQAYDNSILTEQSLTDQLQARAQRGFAGASGVESLARQDIDTGAGLGGRSVNNTGATILANQANVSSNTRLQGQMDYNQSMQTGVGTFLNNRNVRSGLQGLFGGEASGVDTTNGGYGRDVGPRFNDGLGGT